MPSQPNFLIFFTDQQRWDTLGINGYPEDLTPNLDRLAQRGTFFKEAVTPQPVCGPCRSCLQTGQYATTAGVWKNGLDMNPNSPKLAELLKQAGYRTSYFGKWHLSSHAVNRVEAVPESDRAGYEDWLAANAVEICTGPYSVRLWNEQNEEVQLPGYRVDAQTDAMIRYLQERAEEPEEHRRPFFCMQSYIEPHHQNTQDSYPAPRGYEERYRYAPIPPDLQALGGSTAQHWSGYLGMIKRLDEALGRTLDALESTGLADNTVIVFLSDHGCHFKTRNREYKRSPHESSLRIPFVWAGPGWDGGGEHREAVSLVDFMPSILECAGLPIPEEVQGRSLAPLTRNETAGWPSETFAQFGDGFLPPGRAVRTQRWKYAVTASEGYKGHAEAPEYIETHLYDLQSDPYELKNLIGTAPYREVCDDLKSRLLKRMEEAGEPPANILDAPAAHISGQRTVEYPNTAMAFDEFK
jgi:arylsulfatase A-like enzyme